MKQNLWKRALAGVLSSAIVLSMPAVAGAQSDSPMATDSDPMWENFQNPPDYLKSRPLWFWNTEVSDMTVEKVQEIMERSYEESGYYGFGILPQWLRGYMSEEYMELYRAALEKAEELGMKMCLYDENGFPSGSAGGILAATYPEATSKRLDKIELEVEGPQTVSMDIPDGTVLGAVVMDEDTKEIIDISDTIMIHYVDESQAGLYCSSNHPAIEPNVYTVDQAFDGDYETRWNSAPNGITDQWLEVNYGEPTAVDQIVLYEAYDRIGDYALQYHDGTQWVDIVTGHTIGETKNHEFETVNASRYRLLIQNLISTDNSSSIYEMELYHNGEKIANPEAKFDHLTCEVPEGNWKLMTFAVVRDGYDRVDYLDSECVDKFIEVTHEAYYEEFSEYFGTVIDSAFYDEPPLYQTEGGRMWTEKFNEKFEAKYGYDPLVLYPALWYDIGEDTTAARNALFGFRAELFATEYIKRMNDWCNAHGIQLTGHMDQEEIVNPTSTSGDLMKVFQYQDMPGIDEISSYNRAQKAYKVVSSAAYNWDKGKVMTEIYGAMGEGMGVDVLYKDAMDELAKGINLFVPHAVWYDNVNNIAAPPELSYRSEQYGPVLPEYNNYIGRAQGLLQDGRHVADIGVLYPIATLNGGYYFDGSTNIWGTPYNGITPKEADYMEVGEYLSTGLRRDFTYIHPETLVERCSVDGDVINLNNEINYEQYKVFVMPGSKIIDYDALLQIKTFYDQGGKVIATTQLPYLATDPAYNDEVVSIIREMFGVDPTPEEEETNPYTASSTFFDMAQYAPEKAFDGEYGDGSRWNAGDLSGGDEWLAVDFGEEVTINRTVLTENPPYRVTGYRIQYWDGAAWQDVAQGTAIGDHKEDTFEPITTQKLRLYVDTITADSVSIQEFEVYYNDSENLACQKTESQYTENGNANGGKAYYLGKEFKTHFEQVLDDCLDVYDVELDPVTVAADGNFSYIHKVKDGRDIYFFANSTSTPIDSYVNLRGEITPSVWDPHTGTKYTPEYSHLSENGETYTRVKLDMDAIQSVFIVDASVESQCYTVTVESSAGGSASASPASAAAGTEVTLLATPDSGYHFKEWQVVHGNVTVNGNTFTMPAEHVTVKAIFEADSASGGSTVTRYTITVQQTEGGRITPATCRVDRGDDKTFAITANEGCAIADVLVDGKSVGKVSTYTFENVKSSHTITAQFEKAGESGNVGGFTDVKADDWFAEAVRYVVDHQLMNGVAEDKFAPNSNTTRAMIVTILYRQAGSPAVESDDAAWWSDARVWAMEEGISDGTSMEKSITREQLAAMLYRYAGSPAVSGAITGFADAASISGWAEDAMLWAVQNGILTGSGDALNPQGNATRAQVAAMLMRFEDSQ